MDLRRTVAAVAALNGLAFGGEVAVALAIGSVALLADSLDFLEDASINLLILLGLGWGAAARARLGRVLALVILVPGLGALWMAWQKLQDPVAPDPLALTLTAGAALLVNFLAALLIAGTATRAARSPARPFCPRATTSSPTPSSSWRASSRPSCGAPAGPTSSWAS
jgi:Co/Zn/Cd efflux system component